MKIVYIHQYFCIPSEPGGTRSYWIAKELINRGHQVTMITCCKGSHPEPCKVNIDGIDVVYVKNYYSNYLSTARKLWCFVKFVFKSAKKAQEEKDVDMVFATSTPLTVGAVALWLRFRKGWKYVFEVRDLWPEFPIQVGAVKNPIAIKLLRWFERKIYEKSEHVVALSPGMQDGVIATGTPKEKTTMVPNMSKPDLFYPHEMDEATIKQFDIDTTKFNVIHFGSMGRANGLEYIIEAAKACKDKGIDDINFLFMGGGATEPVLKKLVDDYKLTNVKFLGKHNMATVIEVVNCCDASITTFRNLPILQTNSPNKLFDSLSAGKPIIVNSAGWTKDMVEQENCGFYVDVEHPEQLAEKLVEVKDNKELLAEWGKNARRISIEKYDKSLLSSQVADVIEQAYKNLKKQA